MDLVAAQVIVTAVEMMGKPVVTAMAPAMAKVMMVTVLKMETATDQVPAIASMLKSMLPE